MAAAVPEIAGTAAGAAAGAASGQGGGSDGGSPAAFMVAIVLLVAAMVALWLAFHTPAEWDAEGGQFPGLVARIIQWMSGAAEQPGRLGALDSGGAAALNKERQAAAQAVAGAVGGSAAANAEGAAERALASGRYWKLPADALTTIADLLTGALKKFGL